MRSKGRIWLRIQRCMRIGSRWDEELRTDEMDKYDVCVLNVVERQCVIP